MLSTKNSLAVLISSAIKAGDLLLIDGTEKRTAGDVTYKSTLDRLDILGNESGVAYYQMNGDVTDLSGNYNGIATGVVFDDGKHGQASVFSNSLSGVSVVSTSHVTLPDIDVVSDFTIGVAIKIDGVRKNNGTSFVSILSNSSSSYQLGLFAGSDNSNLIRAGFGADGTLTTQATFDALLDNAYHTLIHVYKGGESSKLYIDGKLASTVVSNVAQRLLINEISKSGNSKIGFTGNIDHIRIVASAASATQVNIMHEELYKQVVISPALDAIPKSAKIVSQYNDYRKGSYVKLPSNNTQLNLENGVLIFADGIDTANTISTEKRTETITPTAGWQDGIQYVKKSKVANWTTTKSRPVFGVGNIRTEDGAPDIFIDNQWFTSKHDVKGSVVVPDVAYSSPITYLTQGDKLVSIEALGGVPSVIHLNDFFPAIIEKSLQVEGVAALKGNVKIVDFGKIHAGETYLEDNPFGNDKHLGCITRFQISETGTNSWFTVGQSSSAGTSTDDYGVLVECTEDGVVVQTANNFIANSDPAETCLGTKTPSSNLTEAYCQVIVFYIGEPKNA